MKLLFFGTPAAAAPFLELCAREHEVVGVVTNPDRPAGRKLVLTPPPVKETASRLGLRIFQPEKPGLIAQELRSLGADMAVVVAYGRIFKADVLSTTRHGFMNVHFSLLPKYRGAAPIEWALINGESRTGVTLFWLDLGMDTGPVQLTKECSISADDDADSLRARLIPLGREALREALLQVASGRIIKAPQTGEASLAPKLTRELGKIDFNQPAEKIHNLVRGLSGSTKAYVPAAPGRSFAVLRTALDLEPRPEEVKKAGYLIHIAPNRGILVQCSPGRLWLAEVQPEGKKPIPAADFIHGLRLKPGDRLVAS